MKPTVFIVDDETLLLRTLSNALRDEGFEVFSAQSVEGGISVLSDLEQNVDVMVLDVKLPDRSGLDLLEEQRNSGYDGPVIVMTAFDSPDSERRCRQLSVDSYLRKPFDLDAMLGLIRGLVEGSGVGSGANGKSTRTEY